MERFYQVGRGGDLGCFFHHVLSSFLIDPSAEALEQPRPRQGPVALHGGSGDAESVSCFVNRA